MSVNVPLGETQCALRYTLSGDAEEMVTTVGVRDFGDPARTAAEIAAAVDAVLILAPVSNAASMAAGWVYNGVTAYRTVEGPGTDVGIVNQSVAGVGSWETPPNNCAILWRRSTGLGGRRNTGRMYWPAWGIDEAQLSKTGMLGSLNFGGQVNRANDFHAGLIAAELQPVLFHATGPSTAITSFVCQLQIATQRRRMRR